MALVRRSRRSAVGIQMGLVGACAFALRVGTAPDPQITAQALQAHGAQEQAVQSCTVGKLYPDQIAVLCGVCADFLVELRGFEPLTSAVRVPVRAGRRRRFRSCKA